jgi:hypothetical protein
LSVVFHHVVVPAERFEVLLCRRAAVGVVDGVVEVAVGGGDAASGEDAAG